MDISSLPIASTSLREMNDIFGGLQRGYEGLFLRYIPLKEWDEYKRITTTYKEAMTETSGKPDEYFEHPKFMREFMGSGVLPSFNHLVHQAKLQSEGKPASASKVGLALSTFHHVMRNAGKVWGTYFDKDSALLPETLKEIIAYFEAVDGIEKAVFEKDAEGNRKNISQAEMLKKIDSLPRPPSLQGLSYEQMAEKLTNEFGNLNDVPLKIKDTEQNVQNPVCPWVRTEIAEADIIHHHYNPSLAAIVYGIRHGGNNILGRPEESPMRKFLETTLGVGMEAGRKIEFLHNSAPDVFSDYDRDIIAKNFLEQRYWIRTARACAMIHGKSGEGFAEVLKLIGKDPDQIVVRSASKFAVLMYAISEVIEKKIPDTDVKMIADIRTLAANMYGLSEDTENKINKAKGDVRREVRIYFDEHLEERSPKAEQDRGHALYAERKDKILEEQRAALAPVMLDTENITLLKTFINIVKTNKSLFGKTAQSFVDSVTDYCQTWINEHERETNMSIPNVCVVGASGMVGTATVEVLSALGLDVVTVDRKIDPTDTAGLAKRAQREADFGVLKNKLQTTDHQQANWLKQGLHGAEAKGDVSSANSIQDVIQSGIETIVISAGLPRVGLETRNDLIGKNTPIFESYAEQIAEGYLAKLKQDSNAKLPTIISVGNPMDEMATILYDLIAAKLDKTKEDPEYAAQKTKIESTLKDLPTKICGLGGILDGARFAWAIEDVTGIPLNRIVHVPVLAAHGETMVPDFSNVVVINNDGNPARLKIDGQDERKITTLTRGGGAAVKNDTKEHTGQDQTAVFAAATMVGKFIDALYAPEERQIIAAVYNPKKETMAGYNVTVGSGKITPDYTVGVDIQYESDLSLAVIRKGVKAGMKIANSPTPS